MFGMDFDGPLTFFSSAMMRLIFFLFTEMSQQLLDMTVGSSSCKTSHTGADTWDSFVCVKMIEMKMSRVCL